MKSFDGYLKLKLGNDYILLASGGHLLINNLYSKVANILKGSYKYTKSNPLTRTATHGDDYSYYTDLNFDAVAGETYVISCETDGNWVGHSGGSYSASAKACGLWLYSNSDTHYSFGSNMPAIWTAPKTTNYHIRINMYTNDNPYTLHFWNMKVERGRRATDWLICTDDPWWKALSADNVPWSGITSKPTAVGSTTQPVYWNGDGFTLANVYPTKASWNYDDMYVSSLTTSGNSLRWIKNGSNNDITVPYATNADKLDGWHNTKFCKVYTRAEIGETPNFDNLKDVDGNQVNGFFESRVAETTGATGKKPPITSCVPMLSFLNLYVSLLLTGISGGYWYIRGAQGGNVINSNASTNWDRLVTNSGTWDINITGDSANSDKLDGIHAVDLLTNASLGTNGNTTTLSVTVGGHIETGSVTVPYATTAGTADGAYLLKARSNITSGGIQYITGQIAFGTENNKAYWGSSNNFNLMSVPAGGTANNGGTTANVGILRIDWSTSYWHDLHFSPNDTKVFHRSVLAGTAGNWEFFPSRVFDGTNTSLGSTSTPVYIDSNGHFAQCNTFLTSHQTVSGTFWGNSWSNGGSVNSTITISGDWENDFGIHLNEGGSSVYGADFVYGTGDTIKIGTRNNSTATTVALTIARGSTTVDFKATPTVNGTAVSLNGHTHSYLPLSGGTINDGCKIYFDSRYGTTYIGGGTGDGASYSTYNISIGSWYGFALVNTCTGGDRVDGASWYCNVRYGHTEQKGNCYAANFYTTSDRNKKKNISSLSEHIRKFTLKDSNKDMYGVIALEVPEMFREGNEGNMTVNYNSILSYYVGILENKVKELEEKINRLENNNLKQ